MDKPQIAIPYQALNNISLIVKDLVTRALHVVAESQDDPRQAAACFELCICYSCGFGVSSAVNNPQAEAASWLIKASIYGDKFARAMTPRLLKAMGQDDNQMPPEMDQWLVESAQQGCSIALESLLEIDHDLGLQALSSFRRKYCGHSTPYLLDAHLRMASTCAPDHVLNDRGDKLVHRAASTGEWQLLIAAERQYNVRSDLDCQNYLGETPILCATRAGHALIVLELLKGQATARLANHPNENPLHFLTSIDTRYVSDIAAGLMEAGADMNAEAISSSTSRIFETKPIAGCCPILRAVMAGRHDVLNANLELEQNLGAKNPNHRDILTGSKLRRMVTWALRLYHLEVLNVLLIWKGPYLRSALGNVKMWSNGKRLSLLALHILGPVSSNSQSGYDSPERFWGYMNHGTALQSRIRQILEILQGDCGISVLEPCGEERNALLFAIRHGRVEAIKALLSLNLGGFFDGLVGEYEIFGDVSDKQTWAQGAKSRGQTQLSTRSQDDPRPETMTSGLAPKVLVWQESLSHARCWHRLPYMDIFVDRPVPSNLL